MDDIYKRLAKHLDDLPAGFPATRDALLAAGYDVREIGNSEAAKLDGGMSCLSLRFSPVR